MTAVESVGTQGDALDLSEHSVTPNLFLVHDPVAFDAFGDFDGIADAATLLSRFLFRERPDTARLQQQHRELVGILSKSVNVLYLSDVMKDAADQTLLAQFRANPNLVFTHDSIVTLPWAPGGYIPGNMKKDIRRQEPAVMARVAEALGLEEIVAMPPECWFEGGDVMPFCYDGKKTLLVGYGPRTSEQTLLFLRDTIMTDGLADEIIGFRLAPWRLNIDGCFFPVSRYVAVANRDSIEGGLLIDRERVQPLDPVAYLEKQGMKIIDASREESFFMQACNFACLRAGELAAYGMTERINDILRGMGFQVTSFCGDDLVKGNGGPHCMTRPIYL
jgi:N-dimethylarginine dimethylaminohydrolase